MPPAKASMLVAPLLALLLLCSGTAQHPGAAAAPLPLPQQPQQPPTPRAAAPLAAAAAAEAVRRPLARERRRAAAALSFLLPLADDGGRLDGLLRAPAAGSRFFWRRRRAAARRAAAAGGALAPPSSGGDGNAGERPSASPPPPPPPYPGHCPAAAQRLLDAIDAALAAPAAPFVSQRGSVDWGLAEGSDGATDSADGGGAAPAECNNAANGCGLNNPSSPYGLVVLPLAPEERLEAKLADARTPEYVKENLADTSLYGSTGGGDGGGNDSGGAGGRSPVWQLRRDEAVLVAGCAPAAAAGRYFGAAGYLYSMWVADGGDGSGGDDSGGSGSNSTSGGSGSGGDGGGGGGGSWLTVFASAGDSRSAVRTPGRLRPEYAARLVRGGGSGGSGSGADGEADAAAPPPPARVLRPRFASTRLPWAERGEGSGKEEAEEGGGDGDSPFDSFFAVVMSASPATARAAANALNAAAAAGAANNASRLAGAAAPRAAALAPFVNELPIPGPLFGERLGLSPTSAYAMLLLRATVGGAGPGAPAAFRGYTAAAPLRAWRLTPRRRRPEARDGGGGGGGGGGGADDAYPAASVVPRRPPGSGSAPGSACARSGGSGDGDGDGAALAPNMTVAALEGPRAGTDAGRLGAELARLMAQAAAAAPARSATPLTFGPLFAGARGDATAATAAAEAAAGPAAAAAAPQPANATMTNATATATAAASLRDATAAALARGGLSREPPLLGAALDFLIARVERAAARAGLRAAHALGAASPFELAGVDWGADCVARKLDLCNGDNRDAAYITSWPLASVGRAGQRLVVAGVNHAAAGTASYSNVAASDPVQRRGLAAFDDADLPGSADPYLAGTPFAWAAPLLFVATFARDCAGLAHCRELPAAAAAAAGPAANATAAGAGAAAPPAPASLLSPPLLLVERAYVNPRTGVGPTGSDLLAAHAIVLTPERIALPGDARPRYDSRIFQPSGGGGGGAADAAAGLSGCNGTARAARIGAAAGGAEGGEREAAAAADGSGGEAGGGACVRAMVGMAQCASLAAGSGTECCGAIARWRAGGCWCSLEGRVLLNSLPANQLGPGLIGRLEAGCGAARAARDPCVGV